MADESLDIESLAAFKRDDAVGWIAPDGQIVPVALFEHIEALKNDPKFAHLMPEDLDSMHDRSAIMEAFYALGWGRIGTWSGAYGGGSLELECFAEYLPELDVRAGAMAEVLGRRLVLSPVFSREDSLAETVDSDMNAARKRMHGDPVAAIARGHAVGWVSPEGEMHLAHPLDPVGFVRALRVPEFASLRKLLGKLDDLFESWQSDQFAEQLDPDEHPAWHRFYALRYVCPAPLARRIEKSVVEKGWAKLERASRSSVRVTAENDDAQAAAVAMIESRGLEVVGEKVQGPKNGR